MPFAITGSLYGAATVSAVATSTVTVTTAPFNPAQFFAARLLGLYTSANVFKGMTWARRFVSTSQLELERPFFDPATGQTVAQAIGDQLLVSKNFSESVVAGLAVSGRVVSITDTCTFGVAGNQAGVCFYDENKLINAPSAMLLSGGLTVFGKLDDYAGNAISASVDIQSSQILALLCNDAAVNFCGYGGRWESSVAPAYWIGGNNQGTAGNTVVLNGVECPNDLLTNTAGGAWARNPTRHQLINCYSITSAFNAIMRRWGNGIIRGGRYKFPNNSSGPISVFGSDAAGTYTVAADPGTRAVVLDMGNGPALVRANSVVTIIFNFTNLITTDFRSVTGSGGVLTPNSNGTNTLRFSDTYTGLQAASVGVILNNSGAVADSVASSGTSWSPSLLRRTCVGATVTVNATSWTYGIKRYGFAPVAGTITPTTYDLGTAGQADNVTFGGVVTQLADPGVTLTQAQAAALASIATLDNLYDAAINWGTASVANAQYPSLSAYPVAASGTVLDLGSRNLVIDGTAASAFAINTGTNTITIKSNALAAGAKFTSLATTSTVTITNGGSITAPFVDANNAGSISVTGPAANDTVEMRRASDNSLIASRTGPGAFAVAPANVGVSVYFERKVGTALVMSTITTPVTLLAAANPDVQLFAGAQVQVANVDGLAREETLLQRPTLAQMEASNVLAKEATVTAARTAIIAEVDAIPTNPLLTNDARLNNLDATVSSRLPTTSYVAPTSAPTSADNAAAVRTNLATELARIDVATSTRLAAASYVAPTVPPTAAQNATAVRTELATELARVDVAISTRATQTSVSAIPTNPLLATDTRLNNLDATVSSRLASSAYVAPTTPPTAVQIRQEIDANSTKLDVAVGTRLAASAYVAPTTPPTAAQNATAVRTELATELARIDVATSTRLATSGYTAPLTSAQTQSAAAAALVAYDAVVPADIAGLATSANVTAAQAVIVTEINANETKIDAVKTDTAAIKAKTDILVNTDLSAVATQASVNALGTPLQASNYVKPPTASEIAVQVEFAITNEGDGRAVLQAIADKIGNENVTATVIAQTVRTALATELARIDAPISSRSTLTVADIPATGLTPAQEASLEQIKDTTSATFGQVSKLTN